MEGYTAMRTNADFMQYYEWPLLIQSWVKWARLLLDSSIIWSYKVTKWTKLTYNGDKWEGFQAGSVIRMWDPWFWHYEFKPHVDIELTLKKKEEEEEEEEWEQSRKWCVLNLGLQVCFWPSKGIL